jgi:hypothetical protein
VRTCEQAAGHQTIETVSAIEERENKSVDQHEGHSLAGRSRKRHSHVTIVHHTWEEQWTITTTFDGEVTQTAPARVGEVSTQVVASSIEDGWVDGYSGRVIR